MSAGEIPLCALVTRWAMVIELLMVLFTIYEFKVYPWGSCRFDGELELGIHSLSSCLSSLLFVSSDVGNTR